MDTQLPDPLGFPECPRCYYLQQGSPEVCSDCAHQTLGHMEPPQCVICAQTLGADGQCRNRLCNETSRSIDRIRAIASYSNPLKASILRLKDGVHPGWAIIFGRLLVGYMDWAVEGDDLHAELVLANPTFLPSGASGHTELVLEAAEAEDLWGEWSFRPRGLRLTGSPPAHGTSYEEKRAAADALIDLLEIDARLSLDGRHVLVYDDVCTTGLQLDRVARYLKSNGASSVEAVVMARTQWT